MKYLFISLLIFVLGFSGVLNGFKGLFDPVLFGLRKASKDTRGVFVFFFKLKDIRDENLTLLEENDVLRAQILELGQIKEENTVLRNQLELKNTEGFEYDLILAGVLGNTNDASGGSIVLDKGSRQGIKTGNNVVIGKYLVGVVKSVSNSRSVVLLIVSPDVSIAVSAGKTDGLAAGQFGTAIEVRNILPSEDVKVNDIVVTSGRDGIFRPGFIVGRVDNVSVQSAQPLKKAYLETFFDFLTLDKVFVIVE